MWAISAGDHVVLGRCKCFFLFLFHFCFQGFIIFFTMKGSHSLCDYPVCFVAHKHSTHLSLVAVPIDCGATTMKGKCDTNKRLQQVRTPLQTVNIASGLQAKKNKTKHMKAFSSVTGLKSTSPTSICMLTRSHL